MAERNLQREKEKEEGTMARLRRRLQKTNKDQYLLTIPKHLVDLLDWRVKDKIVFGFEEGKLTLLRKTRKGVEKIRI